MKRCELDCYMFISQSSDLSQSTGFQFQYMYMCS